MTSLTKWLRVMPLVFGIAILGAGCGTDDTTVSTDSGTITTDADDVTIDVEPTPDATDSAVEVDVVEPVAAP